MSNINRKTLRLYDFASQPDYKVDDLVILYCRENILTGKTSYNIIPDNGQGMGGNLDSAIKRYHGWRGTTNDISVHALGCRKILAISDYEYDNKQGDYYRTVTVGRDIKPDVE